MIADRRPAAAVVTAVGVRAVVTADCGRPGQAGQDLQGARGQGAREGLRIAPAGGRGRQGLGVAPVGAGSVSHSLRRRGAKPCLTALSSRPNASARARQLLRLLRLGYCCCLHWRSMRGVVLRRDAAHRVPGSCARRRPDHRPHGDDAIDDFRSGQLGRRHWWARLRRPLRPGRCSVVSIVCDGRPRLQHCGAQFLSWVGLSSDRLPRHPNHLSQRTGSVVRRPNQLVVYGSTRPCNVSILAR